MRNYRRRRSPKPLHILSWLRAIANHPWRVSLIVVVLSLCIWLFVNTLVLRSAATGPTDAFLVLGGSIRREIYVAELAKQDPDIPILISKGSAAPCIRLIFERAEASMEQVWLEECADSTFDNFFFSTPILHRWRVHKVKLITSPSHLPRALWLGQILLGAHGIWVEPDIVTEKGIPGNRETWLKTSSDVASSLLWAVIGQFYQPQCRAIRQLSTVDMNWWRQNGFKCERQGNLDV